MKTTLALLFCCASAFSQQADILFVNGNFWTVDSARPRAEAVAVRGGKIMAVGSDDDLRPHRGPSTLVLDLKGKFVLPGLIDNHTHFMNGGFQLQNVDLRDAKDETEAIFRIKERADRFPDRWITGGDWDHDSWPGANLPTNRLLDSLVPSTPVFVNRYDGHMALANSHVLRLAGITKDTPDPPGGSIVRDPATGEPTGVLKDEAMTRVYNLIPSASDQEMLDAARLALAEARRFGLTSIQDMSFQNDLRTYQTLQSNGELTTRLYCRLPISQAENLSSLGISRSFGDEWITIGSLKAFADGSLGSSTALFFEPFVSDTSTRGLPSDIVLDGRLERWATEADKARLQLSIHAIGDSANSLILSLFEKIVRQNPLWDRRFRIEHAQHIHPKDFSRFASVGAIASVQPYHAIDDGRWAENRIGHERCLTTYPFKSFLDNNVRMCFGSDWTVAPLNPLLGIYAAVTRRTTDGVHPEGWIPEQKITVQQAIEGYTINNAFAAFEEGVKGSITPGKFADFTVLSEDLLSIDPVRIPEVKVELTMVGGKIVYRREP